MKIVMIISLFLMAYFVLPFGKQVNAESSCMEICKEKNRDDVRWCMYPAKEPQATKECLNTARNNYDACIQSCGR